MREIGVFDAKTHLSEFVDRADHGESFAITKHGRVVAFLVPAKTKPMRSASHAVASIIALRKKIAKRGATLTLQEIEALKKSGRR